MGLGIISHSMHPCESGGVCVLIDRSDKRNRLLHARSVFKEKLNGGYPISHIFSYGIKREVGGLLHEIPGKEPRIVENMVFERL